MSGYIQRIAEEAEDEADDAIELRIELAAMTKQRNHYLNMNTMLQKECAELRNSAGCTRSHPHEEMTIVCERLTEEARNTNKLANECAELRKQNEELRIALERALGCFTEFDYRQVTNEPLHFMNIALKRE